jgi:oligopeptide transport system substrate-binding protein
VYRFLVVTSVLIVIALVTVIGLSYQSSEADFTLDNETECTSLDNHLMRWVHENRIGRALYEGLTATDPVTLQPAPGAAESWEVSPDGLTYTFHLRENGRWSNGDPITATDFYWSWERALNARVGAEYSNMAFPIKNARAYYESILAHGEDPKQPILPYAEVGVRVEDPHTLVVQLEFPCTYFLEIAAQSILRPIHRPSYERVGAYTWPTAATSRPGQPYDAGEDSFTKRHLATRPETMVSNGAYTLEEWTFKRRMILRKNPQYWSRDNVALERIKVLPIDDPNTAFLAYETGVVDWMPKPTLRTQKLLYEEFRAGRRPDFYPAPNYGTYFYVFNCTKPPFDDVRVRRAFVMAVDKAKLCSEVAGLGEEPATVFFPPAGREAAAQADADGNLYYYDQPEGLPYDVATARRELADAGWKKVDGRYQRDGKPLPTIEISYNTLESHAVIAQAIGKMWEEAFGTDVSLRNLEIKVYDEMRKNLDYMIGRYAWYGDYLDPTTFLNMYRTGDGFNDTGWSNPHYDDLLAQAAREPHPGKRFELLKQAETLLVDQEVPIMPIYYYKGAWLFRSNVKGVHHNIRGWLFLKAISIQRGET